LGKESKPKGWAKIWQEIKRPFKQAEQGLRRLYYPLYRLAYKKTAGKDEIVLSELEATLSIVERVLENPALVERLGDSIVKNVLNNAVLVEQFGETIVEGVLKNPALVEKSGESIVKRVLNNTALVEQFGETIVEGVLNNSALVEKSGGSIVKRVLNNAAFVEQFGETIVKRVLNNSVLVEKSGGSIVKSVLNNTVLVEQFGETIVKGVLKNPDLVEKSGESIVKGLLDSPALVEKLLHSNKRNNLRVELDQKTWNDFFDTKPEELKKLQKSLAANTDELSCEVVARYVVRRWFYKECGHNPLWHHLVKLLRPIYPLDYEESERINSLTNVFQYSYKLPHRPHRQLYQLEDIVLDFGLAHFPKDVQEKVVGKDIIDGGSCTGDSAMVFTKYDPRRIYAFEPNPDTIPALQWIIMENAAVLGNKKDCIEIIPLALGKSKETLTLYSKGEFDGTATTLSFGFGKKAYNVDVISIDEFVESRSLDVGLIKLDVEGAEYDTILGAKETIIKQKPLLIISIYHTFKDFFEIKPLIESWDIGYKFMIRHHQPKGPDREFVLAGYVDTD